MFKFRVPKWLSVVFDTAGYIPGGRPLPRRQDHFMTETTSKRLRKHGYDDLIIVGTFLKIFNDRQWRALCVLLCISSLHKKWTVEVAIGGFPTRVELICSELLYSGNKTKDMTKISFSVVPLNLKKMKFPCAMENWHITLEFKVYFRGSCIFWYLEFLFVCSFPNYSWRNDLQEY